MFKKIKILISLLSILFLMPLHAQSSQEQAMREQINELMKARNEMINSLLNDSGNDDFDKHFQDMVKRFNDDSFGMGDNNPGIEMGDIVGEYDWRDTGTHEVFALKVKQIKNKPLDIKIEKGQIKLKGDVESAEVKKSNSKRISKIHFERSFSIPEGVDQTNPEFENKEGELLIKFKKLKMTKNTPKPKLNKQIAPIDQRNPVGKDEGDLTI